jgi:hypothetical protein
VTSRGETAYAHSNFGWAARPFRAGETAECNVRFRAAFAGGSYTARASVRWGGRPETQIASAPMHFYVGGRPMVTGIVDLFAEFEVASDRDLGAQPGTEASKLDVATELSAAGGVPIFGGSLTPRPDVPAEPDHTTGTQGAEAGGGDIRTGP